MDSPQQQAVTEELPTTPLEVAGVFACALLVILLRLHTLTEPIDCDEAAYGYVAWQVLQGKRLYLDVFENKPPLAYAPYAIAIACGGYNELAIRLLPVPFVLVTLVALWRCGGLLARTREARFFTVFAYAWLQSDPFVFGNGANLEIYMNTFLTLALWCMLRVLRKPRTGPLTAFLAGLLVGTAAAIKQVAGVFILPVLLVLARRGYEQNRLPGLAKLTTFVLVGAAVPWAICAVFCLAQGSFGAFIEAVFVYAPEVARAASERTVEVVSRKLSAGLSPVPPGLAVVIHDYTDKAWMYAFLFAFGNPLANAWWGTGVWPLLVLSPVTLLRTVTPVSSAAAKFFAAWYVITLVAICWPGLFWQHYYMLLLPCLSLVAGIEAGMLRPTWRVTAEFQLRRRVKILWRFYSIVALLALVVVIRTEITRYVRVSPQEITSRYKGGKQWVALRKLGRDLRQSLGKDRLLFVWGWQSPLYLYTNWEAPTPYFFTDPLMQAYIHRSHPFVDRRKERILQDLTSQPPHVVFLGEDPFPALEMMLRMRYANVTPTGEQRGLFVRFDLLGRLGLEQRRGPRHTARVAARSDCEAREHRHFR